MQANGQMLKDALSNWGHTSSMLNTFRQGVEACTESERNELCREHPLMGPLVNALLFIKGNLAEVYSLPQEKILGREGVNIIHID